MWQRQAQTLPQPDFFGLSIVLHVDEGFGSTEHGTQSDAQHVEQMMLKGMAGLVGIGHLLENLEK